jgi:hypothetical protein
MIFINLLIVKLMHGSAYLAITYKMVHNYLSTGEHNILNVHQSEGFGILLQGEGFFTVVANKF